MFVISALGKWRQVSPWGALASSPLELLSSRKVRDPVLITNTQTFDEKQLRNALDINLRFLCTHAHAHVNMYM